MEAVQSPIVEGIQEPKKLAVVVAQLKNHRYAFVVEPLAAASEDQSVAFVELVVVQGQLICQRRMDQRQSSLVVRAELQPLVVLAEALE